MGDRANVYIHEGDRPGVYLYTHWNGTDLPEMVEQALSTPRAVARRNDGPYLTRILIEEIIGSERGTETGWGVSAEVGDGSDRIVDVDVTFTDPVVTFQGFEDEEDDYDDDYCCEYCSGFNYLDDDEDY